MTKSANESCRSLQEIIFHYWSVSTTNTTQKLIGDFGNANAKNMEDWSEILFYTNPEEILSNITGSYASNNQSIVCRNLTTNLKIDLFHSRVVYKNLDNQEKIIGTLYDFVGLNNFEFNIKNEELFADINIRHEVMFFDVTANKIKKYDDPPSFQIKLPYDFFYPFIKINNGCELHILNILFLCFSVSLKFIV